MSDLEVLAKHMESFNRAALLLKEAYASLEKKFESLNRDLEVKNLALEKTILEKEEMKNYLHSILESLTNGVVVTDLEGRIQRLNRCAEILTGRNEESVRGRHISVLFAGLNPEMWEKILFSEYMQSEVGYRLKLQNLTLEIFASPLRSREQSAIGTVFVFRDITVVEKLEEMSKRKEKFAAMGEMAANIAHEIRNPLGSIELFASLLMKELKEKRHRELMAHIIASVKQVDNKIANICLFTKNQLAQVELVEIRTLLEETLDFVEPLFIQGNIRISFTTDAERAYVLGEAEMLKQVFLNIILNAYQAMPDGGNLSIEMRARKGEETQGQRLPFVEIVFSDDGIGIPRENLPKIFDPFFSTKEGTAGLGLTIVHNIVDMHKGSVNVESNESGTVFTVLLPLSSCQYIDADLRGERS